MKLGFVFLLFFFSLRVQAGLYGELNLFYNTDSFKTSATSSNSKNIYSLDIYANLENKYQFYGGFHVDQAQFQESDGTTQVRLSSLNMGPMIMWVMDRRSYFTLTAGYNIVARGTYSDGTSNEALTGTGLFASIGATPEIDENLYLGVRLNYYNLNFSKSIVGEAASDVSYSRGLIFPSITLSWRH